MDTVWRAFLSLFFPLFLLFLPFFSFIHKTRWQIAPLEKCCAGTEPDLTQMRARSAPDRVTACSVRGFMVSEAIRRKWPPQGSFVEWYSPFRQVLSLSSRGHRHTTCAHMEVLNRARASLLIISLISLIISSNGPLRGVRAGLNCSQFRIMMPSSRPPTQIKSGWGTRSKHERLIAISQSNQLSFTDRRRPCLFGIVSHSQY